MSFVIPRRALSAADPVIDVYLRWLRPLAPAACAVGFLAGWLATGAEMLLGVAAVLVLATLVGLAYRVAATRFPVSRLLATSVLVDGLLIAAMVFQADTPSRFGTAYMWTFVVAGLLVTPAMTMVATAQAIVFVAAVPWLAGDPLPPAEIVTKAIIFVVLGAAFAFVRSRQIELAASLEHSRRQLTEAQRVASIGSWEWQPDTGELTWSDEMYRLWSLEPGSPISFELFQALLTDHDRQQVLRAITAAVEHGERYDVDLTAARRGREPRTLRAQGAMLTDSAGREWMVGTAQDVTELRRIERVQNEFVASASHELRTPATIVYGFADTLLERWHELPEELRLEFVRHMHSGATRLGALIEDLLHITRVEAQMVRPEPERVDMARLAQEAATALQDARIAATDDHGVVAWVDPLRLRQVVDNLLVNASRYARDRILVSVDQHGSCTRIVVEDDGPGIPPDDRERVFQRFVRLEHDGVAEGTGLGLYLARRLMELCDGSIVVDASPLGGARFTVSTPAAPRDEPDADVEPPADAEPGIADEDHPPPVGALA